MSAPTPEPGRPEKKGRRSVAIGAIASLSGAAIAAGAIMGIGALNEEPKKPDHSSSASSDPSKTPEASATPTETPEALTVQSVEIPTGLTPEQLGTTFASRLSNWDMAGATSANRDAYFAAGAKTGNAPGYAIQLAESNGDIYAEALFGSDWRSATWLGPYVPNKKIGNADVIELWFKTSDSALSQDVEPFKNWDTVDSVTVASQGADSVGMDILVTSHNNADKNRAEELAPGTAVQNGLQFVVQVTFKAVDGVERATAFDIVKP